MASVLALPARPAADLVRPHAARAATLLAAIPYASVAMVSLAVRREAVDRALDASGFLVPRVEGRTVTACSWTSAKWPHLAGDGTVWLRASVGRDGDEAALALPDDELVAAVLADLADRWGCTAAPVDARVTRWHRSFPQYRPGHLDRVAAIDAELAAAAPALVVAGAALRGLGRARRASARAPTPPAASSPPSTPDPDAPVYVVGSAEGRYVVDDDGLVGAEGTTRWWPSSRRSRWKR